MDFRIQIESETYSLQSARLIKQPAFQSDEWLTEWCSYQINFTLYNDF